MSEHWRGGGGGEEKEVEEEEEDWLKIGRDSFLKFFSFYSYLWILTMENISL